MRVTRILYASLLTIEFALSLSHGLRAQQAADTVVRVGDNDLGGTITSANGPEAGVWVIAETTELPTKLAKIAVTDDRGRYLIPDLPRANYSVGFVDTAWSTWLRSRARRARRSISKLWSHRLPLPQRSTIRRSTGIRC